MIDSASYQPVDNLKPQATARSVSDASRDEEVSSHQWLSIARPTWKTIEAPRHRATGGQNWNHPKSNIWKVMACCWSFFVMGANDSASGLRSYYELSYIAVSVIFLSPLIGYVVAAIVDTKIYQCMGRRGVAVIAPACHLVAYIINCCYPPYPVLVITLALAGIGNGLTDSAWNSWASSMKHASQVLGCLHAAFGLGAVMTPLVLTSLVSQGGLPWYYFYYVMIGCAAVELITSVAAFWDMSAATPTQLPADSWKAEPIIQHSDLRDTLSQNPSARVTWICSVFLFLYVGIELGLAGWAVTFMADVKHEAPFASGLTAAWFWLGLSLGRIALGFVTPRLGERLAIILYILSEVACGLVIHFVPNVVVAAVATAMQGFFLGPLFPAIVYATVRLLPEHMHVTAVGVATGFSSLGSSILPFLVGVVAEAHGVRLLQPFVMVLSALILALWVCLPRFPNIGSVRGADEAICMQHTFYHGP
ncbi:MFS general substrate transporter [Aspergillus japonicus CBS 114.51]|uniref:MFS general substrate transporter n=1 Tax=Aspergillus japonicus CBS 114.51 TaxID=1448312 RepID=A0A8T8X4V6_ASPJA|nr:MFS general substrate transporter [Aspergillus japonicus CBS 114.51]RAH83178.1 MFS general substrate transporter [Aspergillus japonicus CBS 114.51]